MILFEGSVEEFENELRQRARRDLFAARFDERSGIGFFQGSQVSMDAVLNADQGYVDFGGAHLLVHDDRLLVGTMSSWSPWMISVGGFSLETYSMGLAFLNAAGF